MRIFFLLIACLSLMNCKDKGPQTVGDPQVIRTMYVSTTSGLNMREAASASGHKVTTVGFNQRVEVLGEHEKVVKIGKATGKWTNVRWRGKKGWVFGAYLSEKRKFILGKPPLSGCYDGGDRDNWLFFHEATEGAVFTGTNGPGGAEGGVCVNPKLAKSSDKGIDLLMLCDGNEEGRPPKVNIIFEGDNIRTDLHFGEMSTYKPASCD